MNDLWPNLITSTIQVILFRIPRRQGWDPPVPTVFDESLASRGATRAHRGLVFIALT